MNFSQIMLILSMRRKIILTTIIITVLTTFIASSFIDKTYKATSSLVINYKGMDAITGAAIPAQLMPGFMATQVDIINSKTVALRVVDDLKLAENPAAKQDFYASRGGKGDFRDWLGDVLLKNLEVTPSAESSVLRISFTGSDPQFAAAVANAFAQAYQQTSIQLKVEPLKQASTYFDGQMKQLRAKLEAAQNRLSAYQQEKGIVSVDTRLDVEASRLSELSSQLVAAQAQRMDATSRRNHGSSVSADVASNPLIQRLKEDVVASETRLSEISQKLGHNHPQYLSAKAEADKLRASLNEHTRSTLSGISNNERIVREREGELRSALAVQKEKMLEINRTRDELAVLSKDVDNAQRAYDAATQRFTQTTLEGQANQSDVALLSTAMPPMGPVGPKVFLNTFLSFILGTFLGIGFGLIAEMLDRPVRSSNDLIDVLQAPTFGLVDWKAPPRRRFGLMKLLSPRHPRHGRSN